MYIENALKLKLLATSGVTTLVSTRIYYVDEVSQDVKPPYIVFQKISKAPSVTLSGTSDLVVARFQFSVFDITHKSCLDIIAAIKAAIHCQTGTFGTGGVDIQGCFYENETDLEYDPDSRLRGITVDYIVYYSE